MTGIKEPAIWAAFWWDRAQTAVYINALLMNKQAIISVMLQAERELKIERSSDRR